GVETCDAQLGCRSGTPPATDDGIACTVDACDESGGRVTHVADDAACADDDSCTADACDPLLGCTNTPTIDSHGDDVRGAPDACPAVVPAVVYRAALKLTRLGAPAGDDTLSLDGMIRLSQPASPPLHPVDRGLRVLLEDQNTGTIVDASIAGGA